MFKPTIDDILNLLEERARLFIGWTKEDEIQFNEEVFELRQELKNYKFNELLLKNEDQKSNFYLDDDEDDFIESKDDLVLGIDNILSFDLEQPLIYTKKDKFFFFLILLLLLFNGYVLLFLFYFIAGLHMSLKSDEEEENTQESKEWEVLENLTYRAFYIYSLKNKKKK